MVYLSKGFLKLGPKLNLAYLITVNMIIYVDRGVVSGILSILKESKDGGLNLNDLEAGVLGSIFMLGYMIASPIFANSAQKVHPISLMAIGLMIWSGAVIVAGTTGEYYSLTVARAFTGVGEASFVSLAPPVILDSSPPGRSTTWLSMFYACVPVGYAIGFVYGDGITSAMGDWRWAFVFEAIVMAPLIVIAWIMYKDPSLVKTKENSGEQLIEGEKQYVSLSEQIVTLLKNPTFVFLSLGYGAYTFTVGGLAFWGPDFIHEQYGFSNASSTVIMGAITIFSGVVATLIGATVADKIVKPYQTQFDQGIITKRELETTKTEKECFLLVIVTFIGSILGLAGAIISVKIPFIILIGLSEFSIFM